LRDPRLAQCPGKLTANSPGRVRVVAQVHGPQHGLAEVVGVVQRETLFFLLQEITSPAIMVDMRAELGDKVRFRRGPHEGRRGLVFEVKGKNVLVQADGDNEVIWVQVKDLTNFSLAARKAWKKMPERRVGRPKGSGTRGRISVTLRIDRELWASFRQAEVMGLVSDRTATINAWISEKLAELGRASSTAP